MAYDEHLADRIREALAQTAGVTEQRMFGGLAFLVHGHMAIAARGGGGLMVRVDPDAGDRLVETTAAEPMVMRGRPMSGWLAVPADAVSTARSLAPWVRRGVEHASSLPPKVG
jgi:TfoX/Sxy family transcriptional regulator of competence genes